MSNAKIISQNYVFLILTTDNGQTKKSYNFLKIYKDSNGVSEVCI